MEAEIISLKLAEDEFKSKIQQSENVISILKKQVELKNTALQNNNETLLQMQATIDGLTNTQGANNRTIQELHEKQKKLQDAIDGQTKTEEANNRTIQELREKQKQLQANIDGQTKTGEANKRTLQELREKQKQLQATIDGQTKTEEANKRTIEELREKQKQLQATIGDLTKKVEAMNQVVKLHCGQPKDVSTRKLQAVTTSKELKSFRLRIKTMFGQILWLGRVLCLHPQGSLRIFLSRLYQLRSKPILYLFSTEL